VLAYAARPTPETQERMEADHVRVVREKGHVLSKYARRQLHIDGAHARQSLDGGPPAPMRTRQRQLSRHHHLRMPDSAI